MVDILGALQRLSRYTWLCDTVDPGLLDLWKNLSRYFCRTSTFLLQNSRRINRGGILEQLFISRLKIMSISQTAAYSPVTGRRTIAHKAGLPAFEGPMPPVNDYTPLEEYYKQETEYLIKSFCMGMERWANAAEPVSSLPSPTVLPITSDTGRFVPSSLSTDASSLGESYTFTLRSSISSLLPGIGYLSAKALQWIGDGSLDAVAHAVIWRRTSRHLSRLKKWQRLHCAEVDHTMQKKLFIMIWDALEMSQYVMSTWGPDRTV